MSYKISCRRCDLPVEHVCDDDFKEALTQLLTWVPTPCWASKEIAEAFRDERKRQGDEGAFDDDYNFEHYPFYGSQAWTYLIWHKEDARTFHALLNNLMRAAGIDPHGMDQLVSKSIQEAAEVRVRAAERQKEWVERRERARQKKAER